MNSLIQQRPATAESGSYSLAENDSELAYERGISVRVYALDDKDAALLAARAVSVELGVYNLTGLGAALFLYSRRFTIESLQYDLVGQAD